MYSLFPSLAKTNGERSQEFNIKSKIYIFQNQFSGYHQVLIFPSIDLISLLIEIVLYHSGVSNIVKHESLFYGSKCCHIVLLPNQWYCRIPNRCLMDQNSIMSYSIQWWSQLLTCWSMIRDCVTL